MKNRLVGAMGEGWGTGGKAVSKATKMGPVLMSHPTKITLDHGQHPNRATMLLFCKRLPLEETTQRACGISCVFFLTTISILLDIYIIISKYQVYF